jgi:hypothetical protein
MISLTSGSRFGVRRFDSGNSAVALPSDIDLWAYLYVRFDYAAQLPLNSAQSKVVGWVRELTGLTGEFKVIECDGVLGHALGIRVDKVGRLMIDGE